MALVQVPTYALKLSTYTGISPIMARCRGTASRPGRSGLWGPRGGPLWLADFGGCWRFLAENGRKWHEILSKFFGKLLKVNSLICSTTSQLEILTKSCPGRGAETDRKST